MRDREASSDTVPDWRIELASLVYILLCCLLVVYKSVLLFLAIWTSCKKSPDFSLHEMILFSTLIEPSIRQLLSGVDMLFSVKRHSWSMEYMFSIAFSNACLSVRLFVRPLGPSVTISG